MLSVSGLPTQDTSLLTAQHTNPLERPRDNGSATLYTLGGVRGVVLLDRTDFTQKMGDILKDASKFGVAMTERDTTHFIQKSFPKH